MSNRTQSLLIGAAIAALVTLPAFGGDPNWVTGQRNRFDVKSLKVEDAVATLKVEVTDKGPVTVQISGLKQRLGEIKVEARNGELHIEGHNMDAVWDWSHWFDFSHMSDYKPGQLIIAVSVPKGTSVAVEDLAGNATIGDTDGPMKFSSAGYTESTIGNVSEAHISIAGAGRVTVGNVTGPLSVATAGNGDIKAGDVASAKADIAGSGSIQVKHIARSLKVDIAGSGDFTAASVNGPTHVDIAGSGSVSIANGLADPLHVDIMGSGSLTFGGTAVDPKISSMGSGNVSIKAYRGKLSNEGMSNLKIGN